jgi:bifunctional non-homologous end joining protein LigD
MKFAAVRPYADPEKAARKLVEIANAVEAIQDGRIYIEQINDPLFEHKASPAEYKAGLDLAVMRGLLYRLIVQRDGKRVRLFTRNGHDWTDRYPLIVEAALRNRSSSFVIDGEAVLLGVDGVSDFDGLHSRQHDDEVQHYAFDALMLDGDDLRKLPLAMRKTNLARLLARRPDGIFISDFESGEIGPELYRKACEFGLEGLVSKHRDRAYRAGTSPSWVKVKNPKHPAMTRVMEAFGERS